MTWRLIGVLVAACLVALTGCATDETVGVYYYPWYGNDFHGGQYLREHLVPSQQPTLGEYDDTDPAVIAEHIAWSEYAGIDVWVASWWGPGSREDQALLGHILPHPDLGSLRIAVFYETVGLTNQFTDYSAVSGHISHLAANYFDDPHYLKIDGRPVLFIYLTRVLAHEGRLADTMATIRSAAKASGHDLYLVGDQAFGTPAGPPATFNGLDAITNYDVYGSMEAHGHAGQAAVDAYFAAQDQWRALANEAGVDYLPSVTPGFNDTGVRQGHDPLSRRLTAESESGSLFRSMLTSARDRTDDDAGDLVMVTSWNEWHEDTQIEPVAEAAPTSRDDSVDGDEYTRGLSYEGYGTLYLDILRGHP
jgi:hypothetical protein